MESGNVLSHAVVFEHVQQSRLSCIVETQEHQLTLLLAQTCNEMD